MISTEAAMTITETFPAPTTTAGEICWLPNYISLSRAIYASYAFSLRTKEINSFVDKSALRWGITRRCALAMLTGEATYEITPENIIITRTVVEE